MNELDLKNVEIYDDHFSDTEIIKEIIKKSDQDEPFFLFNIKDVVQKHRRWITKMPRVIPHFAVKSNPDPTLIQVLAALNASFDCASMKEIQLVMKMGVPGERIIYANPTKAKSHIKFAKKVGVERTVVDSKGEILKLKELFPNAKLVIRIAIDGSADKCGVTFSRKFGCEPTSEVLELMEMIKKMEMSLLGFSFHLGSPCWDTTSFGKAVEICKGLIKKARAMGHLEARLIDIGGGIDGIEQDYIDKVAKSVNAALNELDPSIEIISEPGRYYVDTAFTLAALVHSKKIVNEGNVIKRFYYVNDGTYGSFIEELLDIKQRIPTSLYHPNEKELFPSVIWGRTCDPYDVVVKNEMMQNFPVGDWMIWENMGAYTLSNATIFNGYTPATVKPFLRKSALKYVQAEIEDLQGKNKINTTEIDEDQLISSK